MSQDVTKLVPTLWSRKIQEDLRNDLVSAAVSNFEEQSNLTHGGTVKRPTPTTFVVNDYDRTQDNSAQDLDYGEESLTINNEKVISFYIDKFEEIQSKYSIENDTVSRAKYLVANEMDATRFKETLNAALSVDAGDVGGSAGSPIALSTSLNSAKLFAAARAKLTSNAVEGDKPRYAVISPEVSMAVSLDAIGSGFVKADNTLQNGYKGDYLGFKVFESNNLTHSTKLSFSATAVADDTFSIAGVVFKFVDTATNPGEITKGANAAASVASAIKAINGVADATVKDVSAANRKKLKDIKVKATAISGTNNAIVEFSGLQTVANSDSAKGTFGDITTHNEFGRMGAVDMVIQDGVKVQMNKEPKRLGYTFLITSLYGVKTFTEGAERMVDGQTKAVLSL